MLYMFSFLYLKNFWKQQITWGFAWRFQKKIHVLYVCYFLGVKMVMFVVEEVET